LLKIKITTFKKQNGRNVKTKSTADVDAIGINGRRRWRRC